MRCALLVARSARSKQARAKCHAASWLRGSLSYRIWAACKAFLAPTAGSPVAARLAGAIRLKQNASASERRKPEQKTELAADFPNFTDKTKHRVCPAIPRLPILT